MNLRLSLVVFAVLFLFSIPSHANDYTLTVDDKKYDVELGREETIELPDGKTLRVMLEKKRFVAFETENFHFDYPSRLSPSRKELAPGVHQTKMVSALGTLVLVQEYARMNPCSIVETMISELTEEEVQLGYKISQSETSKKLSDGTRLTGRKATATYNGMAIERNVLCRRKSEGGLLVVTQIELPATPQEKQILELFWKTLDIKMK